MPGKSHGLTETKEYSIWTNMKTRCNNTQNDAYKWYGGRGIKICKKWDESFEAFYRDMGVCPNGKSLDRINNNKGYFKSNCRWATKIEQIANRRNSVFIEYNGEKKTMKQWADLYGLKYKNIHKRINYFGWTIKEALETKIQRENRYLYK